MPIAVACSTCGRSFKAPDSAAGRRAKCPKCGAVLPIPGPESSAPTPPQPTAPAPEPPPPAALARVARPPAGHAVAPSSRDDPDEDDYKKCPFCGEDIRARAKKCKHCGETLDVTLRAAQEAQRAGGGARRARTESTAFQVHPSDEQEMIETMQCFGWNLLATQEVKTVDNSLERRGDTLYSVRTTERYVKLSFSRDVDLPNIAILRKLEQRFNSLSLPPCPSVNWGLWAVLGVFSCGIGWVVGVILTIVNAGPVKEWEQEAAMIAEERQEIRAEARKY